MSENDFHTVPPAGVIGRRRLLAGGSALAAAAALGACGRGGGDEPGQAVTSPAPDPVPGDTAAPPADTPYVPGASWETASPEEVGWSGTALDELAAFVGERSSTTFLVVVGGRLVAEHYWGAATPATTQDVASCQKSVVSTLVGVAVGQGVLGLDDTVTQHLGPGWSAAPPDAEATITVRHLLSMTSGLDQDTLTVAAPPGTAWAYNTTAYQKLRPVLEAAAGRDIESLTRSWLWDPVGVSTDTGWAPRPEGGPFATDAVGDRLWGLSMTGRDMARFGLLVQRRGRWGDDQVVDAAWFDQALVASQPFNAGYGYLWWLNGDRPQYPADLVAALGAGDQKIYVVPSLDLVVTRQGGPAGAATEAASGFDGQLLDRLLAARN